MGSRSYLGSGSTSGSRASAMLIAFNIFSRVSYTNVGESQLTIGFAVLTSFRADFAADIPFFTDDAIFTDFSFPIATTGRSSTVSIALMTGVGMTRTHDWLRFNIFVLTGRMDFGVRKNAIPSGSTVNNFGIAFSSADMTPRTTAMIFSTACIIMTSVENIACSTGAIFPSAASISRFRFILTICNLA